MSKPEPLAMQEYAGKVFVDTVGESIMVGLMNASEMGMAYMMMPADQAREFIIKLTVAVAKLGRNHAH
jgi:hypothetical protein